MSSPNNEPNASQPTRLGAFGMSGGHMTAILRVDDHATREQIAEAIAELRARARRYSLTDRRRVEIDEEVDLLVTEYLAAEN